MSDSESRSWNRFNSDFRIPQSDDAARVAHEVKASIDTWIQNSLSQLEADMSRRAKIHITELEKNIAESKNELKSVADQIAGIRAALDKLTPNDPNLGAAIEQLKNQTKETRDAMQAAAQKWEQHGRDAVATAVSIAKTVATLV